MSDNFDEAREALGVDVVDNFLAKFGLGPKYIPKKPKKYTCPECSGENAFHKEFHADTEMNVIGLYCPDCGFSDE